MANALLPRKEDRDQYLRQLKSSDAAERREAAEMLAEIGGDGAVYPLTRALYDENLGVQQAALDALVRIGGELTLYCALPLLRDDSPAVRNMAVEILQRIGGAGLHLLIASLKDRDPDVRKMVADILGTLREPASTGPLMESLRDSNNNVRAAAATALGFIAAAESVEGLIDALHDEEWVAFFAAGALGRIGDHRAIPALVDLIRSKTDPGGVVVKIAALEALGEMGDAGIVESLLPLMDAMDPEIRGTAVKTLIRLARPDLPSLLGEVDAEAFFEDLIGIYRDVDPELYPAVVQTFAFLGKPEGCRPVLELSGEVNVEDPEILESVLAALARLRNEDSLISALTTGTPKMVHVAVTALGRMKSVSAIPHLMSLFPSSETELRVDILSSLGEIGSPESYSFLLISLEDEVSHVRRGAASALGRLKIRSAAEPLFSGLDREEYRDVMEEIVRALASIDRKEGAEEVLRGLSDRMGHPNPKVREAVARGLGELNHPEGVTTLLRGMNDSDWRVRKSSVEALGGFRGAEISSALVHGTWDEREEVRLATLQALENRKDILAPDEEEERIVDALIAALRDDHLRVRCRAVDALKHWGGRRAISHLVDILQREKGPIQILSIEALGMLKAGEAEGILRLAAAHQDPLVAKAASEALSRVTG